MTENSDPYFWSKAKARDDLFETFCRFKIAKRPYITYVAAGSSITITGSNISTATSNTITIDGFNFTVTSACFPISVSGLSPGNHIITVTPKA